MTLTLKHFDTRLNQWIADPNNLAQILTETLENSLLEEFFPDGADRFSFGHMDEYSTPEDLNNHPDGHVLLFSSKSRLVYGPTEYRDRVEQLCPDRKDRGAYGSIFLGSCQNTLKDRLNVLVIDDTGQKDQATGEWLREPGENRGILPNDAAWRLVGDCHGKISPERSEQLARTQRRVLQHRLRFGSDRFGKGTVAPKNLADLPYNDPNTPAIDLALPLSSFKGGDKSNNPLKPGLYRDIPIWIGEKNRSERGKIAASQLLASAPRGLRDFLEELEGQARELARIQRDPRWVARRYCEQYEKRKALPHASRGELPERELDDAAREPTDAEPPFMVRLLKSHLESGEIKLLESQKVTDELNRFVQNEWKDIALGRTIEFERGMIIPSKDLKNGEICDLNFPEGAKILNFRSPYLNSNGMCLSTNKYVADALAPDGSPLEGAIVVNDETQERIRDRLETLSAQGIATDEIVPAETESERQGRDFDGDCIGTELAEKYPNFAAEVEWRNRPENAYAPTLKEEKVSFVREDGSQWEFNEIAHFMSDSISVGAINNYVTAVEALESEIDLLKTYGTSQQQLEYLRAVGAHYQKLLADERPILEPYRDPEAVALRDRIAQFADIAQRPQPSPEDLQQALDLNRSLYHRLVEEGCYQNQIAVDLFKSARAPDRDAIAARQRLLYREVGYIRDKKDKNAYLHRGIATHGYSPVELLIQQTNEQFAAAQLQARPTVQFRDLFPENDTPQQKKRAEAAKARFDEAFNRAARANRRLEVEIGPVLKVQTPEGSEIEIANAVKYQHPSLFGANKASTLDLRLADNPNPSAKRPHRLLAQAPVIENGATVWKTLGAVSEESRVQQGLTAGRTVTGAAYTLEASPGREQVKLQFRQIYDELEQWASQFQGEERQQMAAACWHAGTTRSEGEGDSYKISNFSFKAFPEEVIEQVQTPQTARLTVNGLNYTETNQHHGRTWNPGEKLPVEIRILENLPPEDPRRDRPVAVVEGQPLGIIDRRSAQLPLGTKALAVVTPHPSYTLFIEHPALSQPLKLGKVQQYDFARRTFQGETADLTVGFVREPPAPVLQLNGQILGKLDAESVASLEAVNLLQAGLALNVSLQTAGNGTGTKVLATTPKGNVLRAQQAFEAFKSERFNGQSATVTIGFKEGKLQPALFEGDKVLGIVTQKQDRTRLQQAGLLAAGRVLPGATLTSKIASATLAVAPESIEYPQEWVGLREGDWGMERRAEREIEGWGNPKTSLALRLAMSKRPSLLLETPSGEWGLVVDRRLTTHTRQWLEGQGAAVGVPDPNHPALEAERDRGYQVFLLNRETLSPEAKATILERTGEPLQHDGLGSPYRQKLFEQRLLREFQRLLFPPPLSPNERQQPQLESFSAATIPTNDKQPSELQESSFQDGASPKSTIHNPKLSKGNPGAGEWAAAVTDLDGNGATPAREMSGTAARTTNNRVELTAAIAALQSLPEPCSVTPPSLPPLTNAFNPELLEIQRQRTLQAAPIVAALLHSQQTHTFSGNAYTATWEPQTQELKLYSNRDSEGTRAAARELKMHARYTPPTWQSVPLPPSQHPVGLQESDLQHLQQLTPLIQQRLVQLHSPQIQTP
ncbi:hypothetical protein [Lusitaniella coriacea]|uniref:hypothetical protein n=1 Tax=Lusitaniella coriacea TaxID=1983105 RepID=UPI003CEDC7AE